MAPTIGRNDPCHCGSGKKFKKCCLLVQAPDDEFLRRRLRQIDDDLTCKLLKYGYSLYGEEGLWEAWGDYWFWDDRHPFDLDDPENQAFQPWFLYNWVPHSRN